MVTGPVGWMRGEGVRWALLATLAGLFVLTCLRSLLPAEIVVSPGDTAWFVATARLPASDLSFWMSSRPWGYPLLLKMCGLDQEAIATGQFVLHITSHIAFAFALFVSGSRTWAALIPGAAVLAFGVSPYLTSWTLVLLSESLALSTTAVFLGSLALLLTWLDPSSRRSPMEGVLSSIGVVGSGFLLGGSRDTWPWFLVLVAVVLILQPLANRPRPELRGRSYVRGVVAALLVMAFALNFAGARQAQRWRWGLTNVVLMRVLPDEQARTHWHAEYGLPLDATLIELAGQYESAQGGAIHRHVAFNGWLQERGLRSYATEILSHPFRTTREVLTAHSETRKWFSWEYSNQQGARTWVARAVQGLLFHRIWLPSGLDFLVAISAFGWLAWRGPPTWRGTALALLCFAIYMPFLAAMSYLSDPNEIYRHSLQVSVGLRLLRMLAVLAALGWVVNTFSRTGTPQRPA